MNTISLAELCDEIKKNHVVLPDFQRDYVWGDNEEKQKKFLSSVLAKIPLGNIITFNDDKDSFACKKIGSILKVDNQILGEKVNYLLDGQQRLTTLEMIFSNRLYLDNNGNLDIDNLASKKLLKRFMIKMSPQDSIRLEDDSDCFGYLSLMFPFEPSSSPDFCSIDVETSNCISITPFKKGDSNKWFFPRKISDMNRSVLTDAAANELCIPLFWLLDDYNCVENVVKKIADKRCEFLKDYCSYDKNRVNFSLLNEKCNFVNPADIDNYTNRNFLDALENRKEVWTSNMSSYLKDCISHIRITDIQVEKEGKERAIDIYEALNKGGVALSTYDLIIARAAKDPNVDNLNTRLIEMIKENHNPQLLRKLEPSLADWSCNTNMNGLNSDNRIQKLISSQFLNMLSIISYFHKGSLSDLNASYCKDKKILELTSQMIVNNYKSAMNAILDALMFLQLRRGVYQLGGINYNLSILPIAYAFYIWNGDYNDDLFNILNAWYLTAMFTDFYMMDQSTRVIDHIKDMRNLIVNRKLPKYFIEFDKYITDRVLKVEKYNDLDVLLCCDKDNKPSAAVLDNFLQFYLAKRGAMDILKKSVSGVADEAINAWSNFTFEAHHVIPLYFSNSIKIKDADSKRNEAIIYNSVMNKVLILKDSNRKIGAFTPQQYSESITSGFFTKNNFNNMTIIDIPNDGEKFSEDALRDIFEERYNKTRDNIIDEIKQCVDSLKSKGYA